MAALERYYKAYAGSINIDIDVIDLPQVDYIKQLKDVQDRAATITLSELERKASTGDAEAMIELALRCVIVSFSIVIYGHSWCISRFSAVAFCLQEVCGIHYRPEQGRSNGTLDQGVYYD